MSNNNNSGGVAIANILSSRPQGYHFFSELSDLISSELACELSFTHSVCLEVQYQVQCRSWLNYELLP